MLSLCRVALICLLIVSCGKSSKEEFHANESYIKLTNIFGSPEKVFFKIHQGKDSVVNAALIFQNEGFKEKLELIKRQYKSIEPGEDYSYPKLWLISSTWKEFSGSSKEAGKFLNYILAQNPNDLLLFFNNSPSSTERIILCRSHNEGTLILLESHY